MSKEEQCKCCKEYWWEMNIHSQSGLCPNCYDYVTDLEAKLAESESELEKQKEKYDKLYACYKKTSSEDLKDKYHLAEEIEELKQQLAEKEKELNRYAEFFGMKDKDFYVVEKAEYDKMKQGAKDIVDKLKQQLAEKEKELEEVKKSRTYIMNFGDKVKEVQVVDDCDKCIAKHHELTEKVLELSKKLAEKEKEVEYFKKQASKFNNEAQKYYEDAYCNDFHNQDKISFAVEKLQEAKRLLEEKYRYDVEESEFAVVYEDDVDEIIDNKIEELRKEMK